MDLFPVENDCRASCGHGNFALEPESTESEGSSIAGHLLGTPSSPKDALIVLNIELTVGVQIDLLVADLADSNL
jgi:hypothetical protein